MEKAARGAPARHVKQLDAAVPVLALPLAIASYHGVAERHWIPSMYTLLLAIALALVLWAVSPRVRSRQDARADHAGPLALGRHARWIFTPVAVACILGLAMAGGVSPMLAGLYLAFALALLVGTRLGSRAMAIGVSRAHDARGLPARATRAASSSSREIEAHAAAHPAASLRERELEPAAGARPADVRPQRPGQGSGPAPAPGTGTSAGSGNLLESLRSSMDEVSYRPGTPNVLSMTKYLRDERVDRAGGLPARAAPISSAPVDEETETSCTRTDDGDGTVLEIGGVLDAVSAPTVRPTTEALVAERRTAITVDLASLRLIDSVGVGLIVGLFKRCRAFGGVVRVRGLRDQPLAIFRLLRLDRIFDL